MDQLYKKEGLCVKKKDHKMKNHKIWGFVGEDWDKELSKWD